MKLLLTAIALTAGMAASASAQGTTSSHTVNFVVQDVNTVLVTGTPSMTVDAGVGPTATATDNSTTFQAVTNSTTPMRVTAELDADMPTGVTLAANPSGPASTCQSILSTTPLTVLSGLQTVNATGTITYTLTAGVSAVAEPAGTRQVTYTILP